VGLSGWDEQLFAIVQAVHPAGDLELHVGFQHRHQFDVRVPEVLTLLPKTSFFALKAFKALADAPDRPAVLGEPLAGVIASAGASEGRTDVAVLLSKFCGPAITLAICPSGLPWPRRTPWHFFLLDGDHDQDLTRVRHGSLAPGGWLV
jgi:hypothetical protein